MGFKSAVPALKLDCTLIVPKLYADCTLIVPGCTLIVYYKVILQYFFPVY